MLEQPLATMLAGRRRALSFLALLAAAGAPVPVLAQHETTPWPPEREAPALEAQDLQGKTWRLSELRGRVVLLNFWASWCEPCRAEMPSLQTLADFHGPDRLVVLAVNFKEHPARAARFLQNSGTRLTVLRDPQGEIARAWDVRVFPTTIVIDTEGRPRQRIRGELDWTGPAASSLLSALLAP